MPEANGIVHSMTGFGAGAVEESGLSAQVEIKCVNNRGLKLSVRSRPSLGVCEKNLRELATERLTRGTVDIHVAYERQGPGAACPLRSEAAREAITGLRRLAAELGLADNLSARDLALIPGVFESSAEAPVTPAEWAVVEKAARDALAQVSEMRHTEGMKLALVLRDLALPLDEFLARSVSAAPLALERSRARLRLRLAELCPNGFRPADNQALEREMCLIADRADIREELDRLASHLAQYRAALDNGGEIGKRIEFLAQELLREINTIASKINDAEIIQEAVKAKLAVEKIKEQSVNLV
ncbi:MAG: YicC family protein [Planctomycetes bacterium]|nr:YicC family protein [Planctomycetota bacterium]